MLLNVDLQVSELISVLQSSSENDLLGKVKTTLTDLISLYESGKLSGIKKQDAPLSIKLIPNSDRIQFEKNIVCKEVRDSTSFQSDPSFTTPGNIKEIEGLPITSKYYECIYGLREMYLYRGVCNIY